jgi:hypothetical protein
MTRATPSSDRLLHSLPGWLLAVVAALLFVVLLATAPATPAMVDAEADAPASVQPWEAPAPEVASAEPMDIDADLADTEMVPAVPGPLPAPSAAPVLPTAPDGRPQASPLPPQRPPRALA